MKSEMIIKSILLIGIACFAWGCDKKNPADSKAEANTSANKKSDQFPAPPVAIEMADFKMLDGEPFRLEQNKGKVVLMNLWATWCMPCRDEMPDLVAMQNEYKSKNFTVIGLDTDNESEEVVKEFVKEMNLNYPIGWSSQETTGAFFKLGQIEAIPQSFLIDRNGKLRAMFRGGGDSVIENMKAKVKEVVNE